MNSFILDVLRNFGQFQLISCNSFLSQANEQITLARVSIQYFLDASQDQRQIAYFQCPFLKAVRISPGEFGISPPRRAETFDRARF
jgi:hypothetical protein